MVTTNLVRELIYRPIPEKLWHYTSTQGFHGIVSSGNIYATDVRFLNDREEFVHARKMADDLVADSLEFGKNHFPLREHLRSVVDFAFKTDFLDPNQAQIFVASFSDSEDDLSQWRGYSHGTSGVSISFDLRNHRPSEESDTAVTFAPCVYEDAKKKALIHYSLQHFIDEIEGEWSQGAELFFKQLGSSKTKPSSAQILEFSLAVFSRPTLQARLKQALIETRKNILRITALIKPRAFHHEREWRFVLPLSPGKNKTFLDNPIRFRSVNRSRIPYISHRLAILRLRQVPEAYDQLVFPVNDLIIGPESTSGDLKDAQTFLRAQGFDLTPRKSDIPFRNT